MMTAWQAGDMTVHGLRLHYTRTSGGGPPLVLAHGVGDDGLCWTTVAEALEGDYDVIMVDARGHGRSAAPDEVAGVDPGYGPAVQARDLAGLIAALGLAQPIILGHSMGALTTLALAGTYPAVPRAILLEDPPAVWMPAAAAPPEPADPRAPRRAAMAALKRQTRVDLIAGQQAVAPHWPAAEIERWADSKHRFSPGVLAVFEAPVGGGVAWPTLLARITCPALLLTADPAQGAIVTPAAAAALQALIPQVQVAALPDAGHSMRHDQPARYLAAVRAFLTRVTSDE